MGLKWSICPEQNVFVKNHFYYFYLPIDPFYRAKFKKILTSDPEFWQCTFFGPKMVHLPQFFFGNYCYHSRLPVSTFHCAKFKKSSSSKSRVMRMCNFWVQNDPFTQMRIVSENLFASLVSLFMPIYMPKIKVRY